jgi:hypothetical protein
VATLDLLLTVVFTVAMGVWIGAFIVLGVRGVYAWFKYREQHARRFEKFNSDARLWQTSWIRWMTNFTVVWFSVCDVINHDVWGLISQVALLALVYLCTVQIRDREPKEFWKMSPQTQGAGS